MRGESIVRRKWVPSCNDYRGSAEKKFLRGWDLICTRLASARHGCLLFAQFWIARSLRIGCLLACNIKRHSNLRLFSRILSQPGIGPACGPGLNRPHGFFAPTDAELLAISPLGCVQERCIMRQSRFLLAAFLFVACATLPNTWASGPASAFSQDEKKAGKSDPEDTEKTLAELKKGLEAAQKDLAATKKTIADLKSTATSDAKKVTALEKELEAANKAAATTKADLATTKTALTEATSKTESLAKELEAVKAAGGDTKGFTEKLTSNEKTADETKKAEDKEGAGQETATCTGKQRGDTAWILTASALVMFMVPGLALFYGGMVRRKNVLATMMQSMAALAVVGVYWIAIGYSLAFGPSAVKVNLFGVENGGLFGWSWDLFFLKGIETTTYLGQYDVPVYVHVMFQGMFAIITPALISGAIAERIRFWPFCIFMLLWVTFV